MLTQIMEIGTVKMNQLHNAEGSCCMHRWVYMAVGFFCYLMLFLSLLFDKILLPYTDVYIFQLVPLILILLIIKITLFFIHENRVLRHTLLFCSFLIVLLIGTPLYQYKIILLVIVLPLLFDIFIHVPFPVNWVYAAAYLFASEVIFQPNTLWGIPRETVHLADKLGFLFIYCLECLSLWLLDKQLVKAEKLGRLLKKKNEVIEKLTEANMDFQSYAANIENMSVEMERNRISREIHDTVGYTLTNISMMSEACRREIDPENIKAANALQVISEQCYSGLGETRLAMRALRDLTEPEPLNLNKLEKLVSTFQSATGIDISIEYGNLPGLDNPALFRVIYKTIQEGMTNAFRHGDSDSLLILFNYYNSELRLDIRDNGKGMDMSGFQEGLGFRGIQERISPFEGTLQVSNRNPGVELSVKLKVERKDL